MDNKNWERTADDNLTSLVELDEATLLQNVKRRYLSGKIYTDVGDILLAVNPFKTLPIYSEEWSQLYSNSLIDNLSPHVFGVASKAFNALLQTKKNQVCVISGESGAGKTESTKLIIQQLMRMCKSSQIGVQLQMKIIQLNPVLEAFGNAKTLLNDNSSRFGKFIQLMFTSNGRIVGGGLDQYLLEKSRVCLQGDGECNYHIFYYLFDGLHPDTAKQLMIDSPESHHYISSHKAMKNTFKPAENKQRFTEVTESMKCIGFIDEEINQVYTTLAAILHIGDIVFKSADSSGDSSCVSNMNKVHTISQLLKLEYPEDLCFALTMLRTTTRGETVDKLYSPSKAVDVRDALAKALYSRMFHWLVSRINNYIAPQNDGNYTGIGILDIFGFEIFKVNSFEQFCINIANEQLQQYFNTQIFAMEKEEYIKEGVIGVDITYQDNQPVLELFLSRPLGLISLLDEQCRTNGSEIRLLERYRQSFVKHPNYKPDKGNALLFTVQHYAGKVEYCAEGFLDKNRDSLPETVQAVLKFSGLRLVRALFTNYPNFKGSVLRSASRIRPSQRSILKKMSVRRKKSSRHKGGKGRGVRVMTVSGHFRESLQQLMERILSATPHFVRCFKPNATKTPFEFDDEFVIKQLKYTGMLEAVRVRREGFAYRPFFSDFVSDYKRLVFKMTDKTVHFSQETCQKILNAAGVTGWKIGRSRVFLRYFHEEILNRMLLDMEQKAIKIQAVYRGYCVRKRYKPIFELASHEKSKLKDLLKDVHQHSEDSFKRIIELNKVDILLAIERFGHPNKGNHVNTSTTREPEQITGGRKFKPKAVGGIAILLDNQLPKEVLLRSKKNGGNELDQTTMTKATAAQQNTSRQTTTQEIKKTEATKHGSQPDQNGGQESRKIEVTEQGRETETHRNTRPMSSQEIKKTPPVARPRKMSRDETTSHFIPLMKSKQEESKNIPARRISKEENTRTFDVVNWEKMHSPAANGKVNSVPSRKHSNGKINEKEILAAVTHLLSEGNSSKKESSQLEKRSPPPVSPRPKRKIVSSPIPKERLKRNSYEYSKRDEDSASSLDHRSIDRAGHLFVDLEKRSRSVSPAPRRHPLNDSPSNYQTQRVSVESEEYDYVEMDLVNSDWSTLNPRPPATLPITKRPVGGVKLFAEETTAKITNKLTACPAPKSQFTPETPPTEYKLMFENKRDSLTDTDNQQHILPTNTGTLVTPKYVKTYTIQTSPKHLKKNTGEVKYAQILYDHSRIIDDDDDDEDDYVLPFVFPVDDKSSDGDEIIYANCQIKDGGHFVHEYANANAFIKERKSSLESSMPRRVIDDTNNSTDGNSGRSRSLIATRKLRINHSIANSPKFLSNSVPDLLLPEQTSTVRMLNDSVESLFSNEGKGLSIDSPLLHRISILSTNSSDSRRSSVPINEKHKKKKLGDFFKKKLKSKDSKISVPASIPHNTDAQDPVGSSNLPGYLPGISENEANKMLNGQLPGAYIIFTDYSRNGNFIFKLAVSQGRGKRIWVCNIETQHSSTGESGLHLMAEKEFSKGFTNLKSLSNYYRTRPLNKAGLHLTGPVRVKTLSKEDKIIKKKLVPVPF